MDDFSLRLFNISLLLSEILLSTSAINTFLDFISSSSFSTSAFCDFCFSLRLFISSRYLSMSAFFLSISTDIVLSLNSIFLSFCLLLLTCSVYKATFPSKSLILRLELLISPFTLSISTSSSVAALSSSSYLLFNSSSSLFKPSRSSLAISSCSPAFKLSFLSLSVSFTNILISWFLNSSLNLRYSLAVFDCSSKGPTCLESSDNMSFTLSRFSLSFSSFFSAKSFLLLYFVIPAASSKSSLLSSAFPLNIFST